MQRDIISKRKLTSNSELYIITIKKQDPEAVNVLAIKRFRRCHGVFLPGLSQVNVARIYSSRELSLFIKNRNKACQTEANQTSFQL